MITYTEKQTEEKNQNKKIWVYSDKGVKYCSYITKNPSVLKHMTLNIHKRQETVDKCTCVTLIFFTSFRSAIFPESCSYMQTDIYTLSEKR